MVCHSRVSFIVSKALQNTPYRFPLAQYLESFNKLIYTGRHIRYRPNAVVATAVALFGSTGSIPGNGKSGIYSNWVCILHHNICATGILCKKVVLAVQHKRHWMITVEGVYEVSSVRSFSQRVASTVRLIPCVPHEKKLVRLNRFHLLRD